MSLLNRQNSQTQSYSTLTQTWDFAQSPASAIAPYESSVWVHLFHPPTEFSFDEALLLCRHDDDGAWVAWIPSYGEILLNETQFVPLSE